MLSLGGKVWVYDFGREIKTAADLRKGHILLTQVALEEKQVTDVGMSRSRISKA